MHKPKNYLRIATFIVSLIFLNTLQASHSNEEIQKPTFRQTISNGAAKATQVGAIAGQMGWAFTKSLFLETQYIEPKTKEVKTAYPLFPVEALGYIGWNFAKSLVKEIKTDEGETLYPLFPVEALTRDIFGKKIYVQTTVKKEERQDLPYTRYNMGLDTAKVLLIAYSRIQGAEANSLLIISSNTLTSILESIYSHLNTAAKRQTSGSMLSSSSMKKCLLLVTLFSICGAADAGAFDSFSDYTSYFSSAGGCRDAQIGDDLRRVRECLSSGKELAECRNVISENSAVREVHFKIFSVHPGEDGSTAVSCAEFGKDGKGICYYSSLKYEGADSAVTKLCFADVSKPEHTIEVIRNASMKMYLEGLKPGVSKPITAMFAHQEGYSCASMNIEQPMQLPEAASQVCAYSQPTAGAPVTELCYDPLHPGRVSVKAVDESVLPKGTTTSVPRSIVKVPKVIPCPEPHISLFDSIYKAFNSWWYQTPTNIAFEHCEPKTVYEEVPDGLAKKEL